MVPKLGCSKSRGLAIVVAQDSTEVVNQVARAAQKAVARIGEAARDLLRPLAVTFLSNPGDMYASTLQASTNSTK